VLPLFLLSLLYLYNYTYISIDFCNKSEEQSLKITKNAYNVAKVLSKLVIFQTIFENYIFLTKSLLEVL
jgi:hypothetical protein